MTATIVTFSISKGGCAKSTSSSMTAYLLSRHERVLAVDMDNQGNMTSLLTNEYDLTSEFKARTVFEAIEEGDARPYIIKISENLHLIPSNDYLAVLSKVMVEKRMGFDSLSIALDPVMDDYDWIIIDTPPALNSQTILSLSIKSKAGSYLVVPFNATKLSFYAIDKIIEIMNISRERINPGIELLGVLFANVETRSKEYGLIKESVDEKYPGMAFHTIIKHRAATKRLDLFGLNEENPEFQKALEFYYEFVEELKQRAKEKQPKS